MKIYTKTGDRGTTGLFGGKRVSKNNPRLHAYGTIDELNAHLGFVLSLCHHEKNATCDIHIKLLAIQNELFVIGGQLAAANDKTNNKIPQLSPNAVGRLENGIDIMNKNLPELRNFILPGGVPQAAAIHIARTVARRAERMVIALPQHNATMKKIIKYLNRLSDFLFVLARFINHQHRADEKIWHHQ